MSDATRAKFVYGMGEAQVAFGRMAERVAELERTLADVTRERDELREGAAEEMRQRDTYRDMWQAAESRLADAERRGAREGERRGAWAMWERIREGGTLSRDDANEWIWNRYPAVPPEREGARTGRKIVGAADDSASATDFVVTTPPQAAPEPLCDQCLQPLTADESRDHDNPKRHTIRGCNRALGRAMQRIVETARRASGREG